MSNNGKTSYLVKLKPLEPYFLGGERNYNYLGVGPEKYNYLIKSQTVPSQTTLLGALRFAILQAFDVLKSGYDYSSAERNTLNQLIGEKSYAYGGNFDCGIIKRISPLFLMSGNQKYIKTPFNHRAEETSYQPFATEKGAYSSLGDSIIVAQNFSAKTEIADSYVNIKDKKIADNLFSEHLKTRIHKRHGDNDEESYFKKAAIALKADYCFAFYAGIDDELMIGDKNFKHVMRNRSDIVYLGQDKSAFQISFQAEESNDFYSDVEKLVVSNTEEISYALSDIVLNDVISYNQTAVVRTKQSRFMTTERQTKLNGRYSLSEQLYTMVAAGSVFYGSNPLCFNKDDQRVGLNYIVEKK